VVPSAPFVVPPILLSLVLLVSAIAKIRTPHDTGSVFRQLQLPDVLIKIRAYYLLPYGELVLAAGLLFAPGTWYLVTATLTLLLFAAYFLVIARALRFPYAVRCGCFGRLGLGEVTQRTLIRNLVLLALALVTWIDAWRREGVAQRLSDTTDGWWWAAGILLAVATTSVVVWDAHASPYTPTAGVVPQVDENGYVTMPTPYLVLDSPDGLVTATDLSRTAARMLVFVEPTDPAAADLMSRIDDWAERLAPVQLHLVADYEWHHLARRYPDQAHRYLGDPAAAVRGRFGVDERGAVLLGTDGFLAGGPARDDDEIDELMEAAIEQLDAARGAAPDTATAT
jgi:hypothetical protein